MFVIGTKLCYSKRLLFVLQLDKKLNFSLSETGLELRKESTLCVHPSKASKQNATVIRKFIGFPKCVIYGAWFVEVAWACEE